MHAQQDRPDFVVELKVQQMYGSPAGRTCAGRAGVAAAAAAAAEESSPAAAPEADAA